MTIKLGIVMDPIEQINYNKDSSLAMLWAAQDLGWQLYYMTQADMFSHNGKAAASVTELSVARQADNFYQLGVTYKMPLAQLDIILMRKDPPFNMDFIYTTYLLEQAEQDGCLVVNRPQSLRDCNEKLFATQFPECCPAVLVSSNIKQLREFHQEHQDVIYKPLEGMGGSAIFRAKADDPNIAVILETLTQYGQRLIMAQKFIPDISKGDKRILMVDGQPIDYGLARIPKQGETRGNLAAGGRGEAQPLTEKERWICQQVGPTLRKKGLIFVGLDIIGGYLTEINVTSPTCIREIDAAYDTKIAEQLMSCLQQQLAAKED